MNEYGILRRCRRLNEVRLLQHLKSVWLATNQTDFIAFGKFNYINYNFCTLLLIHLEVAFSNEFNGANYTRLSN